MAVLHVKVITPHALSNRAMYFSSQSWIKQSSVNNQIFREELELHGRSLLKLQNAFLTFPSLCIFINSPLEWFTSFYQMILPDEMSQSFLENSLNRRSPGYHLLTEVLFTQARGVNVLTKVPTKQFIRLGKYSLLNSLTLLNILAKQVC